MPEPNAGPPAPELPETDAAKQARLRRLCERKPSGKINVPLALHEKWLKANRDERDSMVDKLDEVGWDKDFKLFYHDRFVTHMTRIIQKSSKLSKKKRRGWHTEESMSTKLKWSKKDRYNKKIDKFYVEIEEEDENVSEDEEIERTEETEVRDGGVSLNRLGRRQGAGVPELPETSDSETDAEGKEKDAKVSNSEWERFKKFADSLLVKCTKLSEIIADLEQALEESGKTPDTGDHKRATKSVQNLENAVKVLEAEFEACEQVKASMAKHKKAMPGSAGETEFSGYNFILWLREKIEAQILKTTLARLTLHLTMKCCSKASGVRENMHPLDAFNLAKSWNWVCDPGLELLHHFAKLIANGDCLLTDLLTYDCPVTGKKRTAGYGSPPHLKRSKQMVESENEFMEYFDRDCEIESSQPGEMDEISLRGARKEKKASDGAACSHVVELAQAEVAHNPRVCPKVREFSAIRLADAEVAVHKFFQRYGLSVPIQVYNAEIAGTKAFPYLKLSDWVLFLWNTGRFARQLVGCSLEQMPAVLTQYWRRFRALFPHHEIFGLEGIDLAHTVPYYSHTDEGRSQKHEPIWILSCHGALGRGTRRFVTEKKRTKPISENEMGLNFLGQTFSTQFLLCTITKQVSNMHPEAISQLLNLFATDAAMLACEGILCDGTRLRLVHIGTKGDLPALGKVGGFTRSFLHVPKRPSTQNPCEGICHLCLGGQEENIRTGAEHFPYEDLRPRPCWEQTMHTVLPWRTEPDMISGLPINREEASGFFCLDLWHIFHLGICKHFVANSLVMIAESDLLPRSSMENKFKSMTDEYVTFCRTNRLAMWITEISRDTLLFPQGSVAPVGKWNKGSCSTTMMLFLEHYCTKFIKGKSDDEQLLLIADGTSAMNRALSTMYGSGYWVNKNCAKSLSRSDGDQRGRDCYD
ncbi:unnamed protein product [Cladocopium goreaui]|uniref:Uncharacterized protein n=1 Tax=Cladocopium goreaui TaxID=2562237 RepID=A0A9P1CXQ9_9DINO|nr:unnamed protein product [Cladocopium goreaui]